MRPKGIRRGSNLKKAGLAGTDASHASMRSRSSSVPSVRRFARKFARTISRGKGSPLAEQRDDDGAARWENLDDVARDEAPVVVERAVTPPAIRISRAETEVAAAREEVRRALAELVLGEVRRWPGADADETLGPDTLDSLDKLFDESACEQESRTSATDPSCHSIAIVAAPVSCGSCLPMPSMEVTPLEEQLAGAEAGVRTALDEMQQALSALQEVQSAPGEGETREERITAAEVEVRATQVVMRRTLGELREVQRQMETAGVTSATFSDWIPEEGGSKSRHRTIHFSPSTYSSISEEILTRDGAAVLAAPGDAACGVWENGRARAASWSGARDAMGCRGSHTLGTEEKPPLFRLPGTCALLCAGGEHEMYIIGEDDNHSGTDGESYATRASSYLEDAFKFLV